MAINPPPSSDVVTARMKATPRRDTPAELQLRKELHSRGFRYRVDKAIVGVTRGRPDLTFLSEKVAIFVDGCFWHSCPTHGTLPKSNGAWWLQKLNSNRERDRRHDHEL